MVLVLGAFLGCVGLVDKEFGGLCLIKQHVAFWLVGAFNVYCLIPVRITPFQLGNLG